MTTPSLGPLVQSFFLEHLITIKGLRPASVRSYRDTIRLFLLFVAADKRSKITRLGLADLSFERVIAFLRYEEAPPEPIATERCTRCSTTSLPAHQRCSASVSASRPSR